jgi:hypothetical protein
MQLSPEAKDLMFRVLRVARLAKIEHIVFDQECVRGQNKPEGVMICHRNDLPQFGFQAMGISRIDVLNSRMNLLGDDVDIETKENAKGLVARLTLSRGNTEVEFRCADPSVLEKAPRIIKDPIAFEFEMEKETIAILAKAPGAVKGEALTLTGSEDGVLAKLNDREGDMFQHVVSGSLIYTPEASSKTFYYSFKNKFLIPLIKECAGSGTATVRITDRGMIHINVLGVSVYMSKEL